MTGTTESSILKAVLCILTMIKSITKLFVLIIFIPAPSQQYLIHKYR